MMMTHDNDADDDENMKTTSKKSDKNSGSLQMYPAAPQSSSLESDLDPRTGCRSDFGRELPRPGCREAELNFTILY